MRSSTGPPSWHPAVIGSWSWPAAHLEAPFGEGEAPSIPGPLEPLALLTFTEELRPEAQATIDGLRERGIDVKIVSGDDPNTVEAIGRRLGLAVDGGTASGLDLAALDDEALGEVAERTTIFGRVDPHLKARLVTVLKARGRYVAMTGDGVNDILPVRTADVGVAMQSGSPPRAASPTSSSSATTSRSCPRPSATASGSWPPWRRP